MDRPGDVPGELRANGIGHVVITHRGVDESAGQVQREAVLVDEVRQQNFGSMSPRTVG